MPFFIIIFSLLQVSIFSEYKAKDFSYLEEKTHLLNDQALKLHLTLYQGYVKNTNQLLDMITTLENKNEQSSPAYGALKRRVGWEFDGMRLHELYFGNIGGAGTLNPKSVLFKELEKSFGSYSAFEKSFKSTGLIRGIGWVVLSRDPISGVLVNTYISEHDLGNLTTTTPLCVLDVWEHAYITQYGLDKSSYIEAFMKEIDWDIVQKRFKESL